MQQDHGNILVIEDHDDTRGTLSTFLGLIGYEVTEAANGQQGLSELRSGERFCLILLDLMMPIMNGWEFRAQQLDDPRLKDIPTVVISALDPAKDLPGIVATLPKPLDLSKLRDVVEQYC